MATLVERVAETTRKHGVDWGCMSQAEMCRKLPCFCADGIARVALAEVAKHYAELVVGARDAGMTELAAAYGTVAVDIRSELTQPAAGTEGQRT